MCGIISIVFPFLGYPCPLLRHTYKDFSLFVAIIGDCRKGIIQNSPYCFCRWVTRLNFALSKRFLS